jgi:ATP-dependent helicase/nuclease subunit A
MRRVLPLPADLPLSQTVFALMKSKPQTDRQGELFVKSSGPRAVDTIRSREAAPRFESGRAYPSDAIVLSAEQQAATLTPGDLLVRAGAGCGKTEVLARRFVTLIAGDIQGRQPLTPEQIGAITFTEKAAYDMRARIAAVLAERIKRETSSELRVHLLRARRSLPLSRISTIHAFCARILRENALAAGLDPDFQVLDESESRTFRERVCKQTVVDAIRRSDPGAKRLLRMRRLESATQREGALEIVLRILDEVARLGHTVKWLTDATRQNASRLADEAETVTRVAHRLAELLSELLRAPGLTDLAEQRIAPLRAREDEYRQQLLAFGPQLEPERLDFLRDLCDCIPNAQGRMRDCIKSIKDIVERDSSAFGIGGELIQYYGACRAIPQATDIAATIGQLAEELERAKADHRVVTFDDLLIRTRDLLAGNSMAAFRYRTTLRALLVDEYQDTDAIQDAIIRLIMEPASDQTNGPELFIVGDEKQSIYRFRGADVSVLGQRAAGQRMVELPLLGNRRSTPNIVKFVNGLGAVLMRSGPVPVPTYRVEWGPHHELSALREPAIDPPIEIITAIPDSTEGSARKLNTARKRELEGRAIGTRIRQLITNELINDSVHGTRPIEYRDVTILLRAFTDVAIYERELVAAGVPCYTVKGRGFFGCQEVVDLIELLTAIGDAEDSMALAAALRSPFFGVSDDCLAQISLHHPAGEDEAAWKRGSLASTFSNSSSGFEWLDAGREDVLRARQILDELRTLCTRGSVSEVIERTLQRTGYEPVMLGMPQGAQRVANLRKLVELARDFESRHLFTFSDFVLHLRQRVEQEPYEPPAQILGENDNVVRLMTVHQAKGLEFPIVVVADAGRRPPNDIRVPVVDREAGLLTRDTAGSGMDEIPNRWLTEFRARWKDEEEAESARLLYVAFTRARERLIISEGAMLQGWCKSIRAYVGANSVELFAQSGAASKAIECGGDASVILARPELTASAESLPANTGTGGRERAELAQHRLNFELPVAEELVISPTALADFDRCPRQFHLRHNLKIPEKTHINANTPPARALAMGTVAHQVLERADSGSEEEIHGLVELLGKAHGLNPGERAAIATDLVHYISESAPPASSVREVPFFCQVGKALFVRGQIDALIEQEGRLIVRDYKYARASEEARQYQVQMETYALVVAEACPEREVEAEVVFLKDGGVTERIELPPLAEIRSHLQSLTDDLLYAERTGEFVRKPSDARACRQLRCGFVQRCWGD